MNFAERWLANRVIKRLEDKMGTGWKGKAGGIGLMLTGAAGLLTEFSAGSLTAERAAGYFGAIFAGLAAFGIRQAIDK